MAQTVPGLDTLTGKVDRYYYYSWYDECPEFSSMDSNEYFYKFTMSSNYSTELPPYYIPSSPIRRDYTPVPLRVKGLAIFVQDWFNSHIHFVDSIPIRLPEYLRLYQHDATYPKGIRLVDSVRWDTAAPLDIKFPKKQPIGGSVDSGNYMYSHVYEAYFPKPVTVDSTFYIGTTYNSNQTVNSVFLFLPVELTCIMSNPYQRNGVRVCDNIHDLYIKVDTGWYWSPWNERPYGVFMAIVDQWNLTGLSSDTLKGVVTGSGRYPDGTYDTLRAVPYAGYRFIHWNDGNTDNPRVVCLTQDTVFTAYFDTAAYYNVQTAVTPAGWGTVEGGGTYAVNTEVELTAVPVEGFMFERWDDGDIQNPRTVTVTQDTLFTAVFALDTTPTGIPEAGRLAFGIAPNPTGGQLTVTLGEDTPCEAEVYDATGRCVLRATLQGPQSDLDVRRLPAGRYTLRLTCGDKSGIKVFVRK